MTPIPTRIKTKMVRRSIKDSIIFLRSRLSLMRERYKEVESLYFLSAFFASMYFLNSPIRVSEALLLLLLLWW